MSDQAALERRYRRLLAYYPGAFRRANEEEILAVLLACAEDGQQRPGLAASADLIRSAVLMRLRPPVPRPRAVRAAVRLMCAGAGLELAAWITIVVTAGRLKSELLRSHPGLTSSQLGAVHAHLVLDQVAVPVAAGLWLFLAWANGRGHDWGRPAFMAFFALTTLGVLVPLAEGAVAYAPADMAAGGVLWLVALTVLVLIFAKGTAAYYERQPARPEPAGR
ncbi:MAG TPA: hypothetical protein VGN41_01590 [Streptosporangiaceae bacterium]